MVHLSSTAAEAARSAGLGVWLGVMVGSTLNSATTGQLLPLARCGDLDGALLVAPDSDRFGGGFVWHGAGDAMHGRISLTAAPGTGVVLKGAAGAS